MALNSGIQTYQILTNDDEVCIPSLSSILLAVLRVQLVYTLVTQFHDFLIELGTQLLYARRMKINQCGQSTILLDGGGH